MKKILNYIICTILCIHILLLNVLAASGYQGYILYRDGNGVNLFWHTGIAVESSEDDADFVVHAMKGEIVETASWENFLASQEFMGLYTISGVYTSSDRDIIVEDALWLLDYDIPYDITTQLHYNVDDVSGNYVYPRHIGTMRCDGVVEYVFELNGYRIYGSDDYWDISYKSEDNQEHHSGFKITPASQADYLVYCHDDIP